MNEQERRQCANNLILAHHSCVPIDPVVQTYPDATVEDAYAIQTIQVATWTAGGQRIVGHKVGLSSAVLQAQMGVDQPDFGHLLSDTFHMENYPVSVDRFILPQVEPQIAFVLGRRLAGPGVTVAEAIRAVDYVLPALEIVDSRLKVWNLTVVDTIADNASSGGVILGSRPFLLRDVDLSRSCVELLLNGESAASGLGSAVLGSPINALVWLANTLGRRGTVLDEGHVVLPGSATRASCVLPGDVVEARFSGMGSVRFLAAAAEPLRRPRVVSELVEFERPDF